MSDSILSKIGTALPNWKVSVDAHSKSGKFRICIRRHNHKVVGLWRDSVEEACLAGVEKIVNHPGITADLPELLALKQVLP